MKSVLVTGGCGFIGSHLVARLLAMPSIERVTVIDNLSSGLFENLPHMVDSRLNFIYDAISHRCHQYFADHDTVFHLASNPDIARAETDPEIDFRNGTQLTQDVLEGCRKHKVARLIYASGSGVYGESPGTAFREDHGPCRPISTYGASKLAGEAMISAYCSMFGLSALAFRFANVVGPRQTHGVGYDFMRRLKADPTKLRILGDGTQSKPYIHVDDVLDAVLWADDMYHRDPGFEVYNVSTEDNLTVRFIAEMAVDIAALNDGITAFEFAGGDRGWKGDVPVVWLNTEKIANIGWGPKRNSVEAMRAALEAMR